MLAQRPDHDREAQQRAREPFGKCKEIALDGLLIEHVWSNRHILSMTGQGFDFGWKREVSDLVPWTISFKKTCSWCTGSVTHKTRDWHMCDDFAPDGTLLVLCVRSFRCVRDTATQNLCPHKCLLDPKISHDSNLSNEHLWILCQSNALRGAHLSILDIFNQQFQVLHRSYNLVSFIKWKIEKTVGEEGVMRNPQLASTSVTRRGFASFPAAPPPTPLHPPLPSPSPHQPPLATIPRQFVQAGAHQLVHKAFLPWRVTFAWIAEFWTNKCIYYCTLLV